MDTTLVDALRETLRRETGEPVALVETHISWVLLTATLACKLKKPVRLPFLDFGSVEARKHFCEEELRLNRRFAPSLYIDVAPVCGTRTSPRIGGDGTPIDRVVRMRRFPESSLLRNLLPTREFRPEWLDDFAERLAGLHEAAPRMAGVSEFGSPELITRAATDILDALQAQGEDPRLVALRAWIGEQTQALRMAWIVRQQSGAVRECHGDLHMANVVLVDGALTPFDCIEFDPALRSIDDMNDIAYLTMDLPAQGRPDYLACAAQLAARPPGDARLLITHGFSGSGKSSVALQLLCAAGAVRVRSDVERKRLHGLAPLARSADLGLDIYGEQATRLTFDRLRACARGALLAGYPVIVDAAFLRRAERRSFETLAAELHVPFAILDCRAAHATLRRRVAERDAARLDASEAGLPVLERQLENHEPLEPGEQALTIEVSTEGTVDVAQVEARWRATAR